MELYADRPAVEAIVVDTLTAQGIDRGAALRATDGDTDHPPAVLVAALRGLAERDGRPVNPVAQLEGLVADLAASLHTCGDAAAFAATDQGASMLLDHLDRV